MNDSELLATNDRLNKRCQQAESDVAYYKARYKGLENRLNADIERVSQIAQQMIYLRNRLIGRTCFLCKFKNRHFVRE